MKDRASLYPGRVKLTPVSGQENTYDMVRADEPTQEGDPLSKTTFLKDATAALFGLDADALPDDVFAILSGCAFPIINVTTVPGATCVLTLGSNTIASGTADSTGKCVLRVNYMGDYTLTCTYSGNSWTKSVSVPYVGIFEVDALLSLEDLSWSFIDSLSESGIAALSFNVGDKKTISIDGTDYQIQIIGFDHDTKTAGGTAGITFQLVDCLSSTYKMNSSATNSGGWTSCSMRTSTMATLLSQLPSELQNVLKAVDKQTYAGSKSDTINTTSDKLFLLSEVEVDGSAIYYTQPGEGSQYDYYKAGNSKSKKVNGSASFWWLRSPNRFQIPSFCVVDGSGKTTAYDANVASGVSFAFCV